MIISDIPIRVRIRDRAGNQKIELTSSDVPAVKYSRRYNDVGSFSLVMTDDIARWAGDNLLMPAAVDYHVEIFRWRQDLQIAQLENTYLLRLADYNPATPTEVMYTGGGRCLNSILDRRIIDPQDDSRAVANYVTDFGNASDVVVGLIDQHLGRLANNARRVENLEVINRGGGTIAGDRWKRDPLLDTVMTLAEQGKIDFSVTYDSERRVYIIEVGELYQDLRYYRNLPLQRHVRINEKLSRLRNLRLVQDYQDQRTQLYLVIEGEDNQESVIQRSAELPYNSPLARIEFSDKISRESGENTDELLTRTGALLDDHAPSVRVTFDLEDSPGLQYRKDWDLGDILTVEFLDWIGEMRVVEVSNMLVQSETELSVRVEEIK